ncbi:MAG: thiamine-phosphate kinase [Dehalococcoidia bacterium]|nr:thiamine-phosphate kinase [Dehalococcoidia bacterium]
MKVSDLGEFGLIDLLAKIVGPAESKSVLVGIGDDAACWRAEASTQLATTDSLIQNVHFTLSTTSWRELGWKALAVSLSDIAAMGGQPQYALVSLGLPGNTDVASIAELYEGMAELARLFDVSIVGGDSVEAPVVMLSLVVIGKAQETQNVLTRSAAAPGDRIALTGYLGASAAGMAMLERGPELFQEDENIITTLRAAHLKPRPRVAEGQVLAHHGVKAAIDLSDGLVSDLSKLCKASGVGARLFINQIPLHPMVRDNFADHSINLALSGGEDYELLFTAPGEVINKIGTEIACPVTVIGEVIAKPKRVKIIDEHGNEIKLEKEGWEHFSKEKGSE